MLELILDSNSNDDHIEFDLLTPALDLSNKLMIKKWSENAQKKSHPHNR